MRFYLFLTSFIPCFVFAGYPSMDEMEQVLCGERPLEDREERALRERAKRLEREMPPVQNQRPAEWCYAFVAADALSYHHYLNDGRGREDFYRNSALVSPMDAVGTAVQYRDERSRYPLQSRGRVDTREGGDVEYVLRGVQHREHPGEESRPDAFQRIG